MRCWRLRNFTMPAADRMMPLASIFVTYPEGQPRFYCPRSGVGDIPGSKGLRAVVLKAQTYFGSPCVNKEAFRDTGKRLAKIIMDNEICGGALPGLGSITLIHLLKSRQAVPKVEKKSREGAEAAEKQGGCRTNYCCAPPAQCRDGRGIFSAGGIRSTGSADPVLWI